MSQAWLLSELRCVIYKTHFTTTYLYKLEGKSKCNA